MEKMLLVIKCVVGIYVFFFCLPLLKEFSFLIFHPKKLVSLFLELKVKINEFRKNKKKILIHP